MNRLQNKTIDRIMPDIIRTAFQGMHISGKNIMSNNNVRPRSSRHRKRKECGEEVKTKGIFNVAKIFNKTNAMCPKTAIIASPGPSIIFVNGKPPSKTAKNIIESFNATLPPKKRKLCNFSQNIPEVKSTSPIRKSEPPQLIKSEPQPIVKSEPQSIINSKLQPNTSCVENGIDLRVNAKIAESKTPTNCTSSSNTVADLNSLPTMPPVGQLGFAAWQLYNMALIPDEDGDFPLHIATAQDNVQAVQRLICTMKHMRSNVDVFNKLRQTPLHIAMIIGCAESAKLLLQNGSSPIAVTRQGDTAIHLAVMYGHLDCLKILLENYKGGLDLNLRNHEGLTPLHLAVLKKEKQILEYLCEKGADKNALDGKSGRTPLFHAVENDEIDMAELLIRHKADVNITNYSGNDPLSTASGKGFLKMVKLLLANNADGSLATPEIIKQTNYQKKT